MYQEIIKKQDITEKFECRQCGNCCRTNKQIPLTLDDIYRISDYLNMDTDDFFSNYCIEVPCGDTNIPMPYLKRGEDGCCFLEDNLCSINFVKPGICKNSPSTMFGSIQYLKSKMPQTCSIQRIRPGEKINEDDQTRESYMVSMILTTAYYSNYHTFSYENAKPYIYRILLIKKNRSSIFKMMDNYSKVKN
ncbi:YkgJ family cysteine cluster protein [Methanocella sp. CWC-04]|uniref:YkgJ family cysteine cluster protein n=1 Tax=Methanooceanicella nereidis TaxID=2052831 RepID=A0AAP2W5R6_9EURY|nr:YkgJ family cysteine cluster protein [Methanocella sp. CWC-04]MCD1295830.1 YkgJ family cysteine cluster protein [Methanocella sp. CWC-04]